MSTKDIDKGWANIKHQINEFQSHTLKVGIQRGTESTEDDQPVANYAYKNEFGIGVPQRSFMRSTIDENQANYKALTEKLLSDVLDNQRTAYNAIGTLGEKVRGDISQKIVRLRTPPNSPITIMRKGSSNPLIDSGQMRQSIQWVVTKDE